MPIERIKLADFGNLELLARQVVEGFITGLHKSPFHGFSVEFAEHRLYNNGESTRHIDWKLFARTSACILKSMRKKPIYVVCLFWTHLAPCILVKGIPLSSNFPYML